RFIRGSYSTCPRMPGAGCVPALCSEPGDVRQPPRQRLDLAEAVEEHRRSIPVPRQERRARVLGNRNGDGLPRANQCFRLEVERKGRVARLLDERLKLRDGFVPKRDARQADRDGVSEEDFRERLADDGLDAAALERLRRVLARGSAAEVAIHEEDSRARKARIVERVRPTPSLHRAPVVLERVRAEPVERDRDEETRRDDPVGVDVIAAERERGARDAANRGKRHRDPPNISRTSATSPPSAAAATIAGLMRSVRPVGLPCRPLKLRFDEEAHTCRPSSRSGFIARHIEQPAPRHSKPASRKTASRPSFSAAALTACEPGTTSAFTPFATFRPFATRAASRRSDSRPFVHDPMNATSIFVPRIVSPPEKPMYSSASATCARASSSTSDAFGTRPDTPTLCAGLIPHVTCGSSAPPSSATRSSAPPVSVAATA